MLTPPKDPNVLLHKLHLALLDLKPGSQPADEHFDANEREQLQTMVRAIYGGAPSILVIERGERIVYMFHGLSASHACVVMGKTIEAACRDIEGRP